ncbi:MAG: hypothetical protein H7840_12480 [Alphaproteobacteria bacterium]
MSQRVAISKVARALGIDRAEMRQRIEAAGIATFEGMVDVADLRPIAPTFGLGEQEIFERLRLIRENAKALRYDPTIPPPPEDLKQRIRTLTVELLVAKQRAHFHQEVMRELFLRLDALLASDDPASRKVALELNAWLADKLATPS